MNETIDPILLLRESLIHKRPIQIIDRVLDFNQGEMKLPLDTPTAWQRKDKKGFYNIGSLYFKMINRDKKIAVYAKQANELKID